MNLGALVMVLVIVLTISFMTVRDLAVSGSLRGIGTPAISSE